MDGLMTLLASNAGRSDPSTPVRVQTDEHLPEATGIDTEMGTEEENLEADEETLHAFRTQRLQFLPLIYIPITATAQDLKREALFLWRCIYAVESKDTTRQAALITFQSQPQKSSLCVYAQMAIALVFELGLNKPAPPDLNQTISNSNAVGHMPGLKASISTMRTMNERRAVLGCFVLTSIIAQFLGRMDPLRWTPHMKECLDILAHSEESPGDAVLAQITRTRLVADQILQGPWDDGLYGLSPSSTRAAFHSKALESRLKTNKADIPAQLGDNKPILFHIYDTEISLYEAALVKPPADEEMSTLRLDHLYSCLHVVKQFFDLFSAINPVEYTALALPHLAQLSHCFVTLFRLSTFDYPGWNKAAVKNTVDILVVADQISTSLSQVAATVGIHSDGANSDPYSKLGMILQKLRTEWAVRLPGWSGARVDPGSDDLFLPSMEMDDLDSFMNWSGMLWMAEGTGQGFAA
ncbi:uncharacterized protein DSM5745_09547 [Aspergillus mulundensis]|uniref:Zn(II)2Cys6 transcription factor n=1 Tax=Aspergillus mulundensis TaxID=1810919 RepID=A0A3D8QVS6_9EURO|nr:Uncharacterized protein DSM5745_09547 [Aspergillus mulundensis]RDW65808.1 Uncharacterized protein DSM5745_09547 [Aspergillus mulundensis]